MFINFEFPYINPLKLHQQRNLQKYNYDAALMVYG